MGGIHPEMLAEVNAKALAVEICTCAQHHRAGARLARDIGELRQRLEREVRYANITIIEGHDASQYGIGIVSARIAEMVLNDERAVVPIGSYQKKFGVTLSLPSVVGRAGVIEVLEPEMSEEEREGLRKSADSLKQALERVRTRTRAKVSA